MSFFEKIEAWFKSVFTQAIPWTTIALGALNVIAPIAEALTAFFAPTEEPVAAAIIVRIQAGLGGVSALLQAGQSTGVTGLVAALQADLAELESAAGVKDADTKAKIAALVAVIKGELTQILSAAKSA